MIVDSEYYEPPPKGSARAGILMLLGVVGFFVFLAVAIPIVQDRGGDMNSFFFVVLGGFTIAILLPVILNVILKKMHLKGKKPREAMHQLFGYTPMYEEEQGIVVPSMPSPTGRELALAPAHPFEDDWEDAWEERDDLNLGYQEEEEDAIPTLLERGGLPLTETFQPDPHSMVCQNMVFVGVRRFGKSNALAILVLALARYGYPRFTFAIIIFDTEGEYEEMARTQHMPRGLLVGSEEMRADVPEGIDFHSINVETAYAFGQEVLEQCLQVVVNLPSWDDDQAAEIMSAMILGMEDWQQQQPMQRRIPFYIVIDEITKWVPQNQGESTLSKEARTLVQHALFDVAVRRGGKRGFGLLVAGQKSADIDKRIFQGLWKFIFCQTEKNDLERCKATPLNLDPDEVNALQPGESFVFCPQLPRGMFVKWPLSPVELGGKSPTIENLMAHHQRMQHHGTRPHHINQTDQSGRSGDQSGRETRSIDQSGRSIDQSHRSGQPQAEAEPPIPTEPTKKKISLEEAARLWRGGANSNRKLMKAMGLTYHQADKTRETLINRRLIDA